MNKILSPAEKAWATRRANANGKLPSVAPAPAPALADMESIMSISLALGDNGLAVITASFGHAYKTGKPVDPAVLADSDKALLAIQIVAHASMVDGVMTWSGHDQTQASMVGARVTDIQAIVPMMEELDSVLLKAMGDSEDHSLPMAIQAIAWDRRITWIDVDGKRSTRGPVYATVESLLASVSALHAG